MPLRSLHSSVLVWPTRDEVERGLREWASQQATRAPALERVGYFGSYARGNWGVGSDLDILVIVAASDRPRDRRALAWDATTLPVPADLVVYTREEWNDLRTSQRRFARTLAKEVVWVYGLDGAASEQK